MRFKSLVSPLALVIGLGLAGGAAAQDAGAAADAEWSVENGAMMINGAPLTDEQAGYVQNYCNDLQAEFEDEAAGVGGVGGGGDDAAGDDDADANDDSNEPTLENLPTSMIDFDLSQIMRDDCIEAGFITE